MRSVHSQIHIGEHVQKVVKRCKGSYNENKYNTMKHGD